jgi:hypothetical protein
MTQHMTTLRSNSDGHSSHSALQQAPLSTRHVRDHVRSHVETGLPGGVPLSDDEINSLLDSISEIDGLPTDRFAAGDYAIDGEPDAIATRPTAEQMTRIVAAADREDLTLDEMAAHSRVLWNAIAYFQRRARDYDEAGKREEREIARLRAIRDDMKRRAEGVAA